jgi:hypothetical protein
LGFPLPGDSGEYLKFSNSKDQSPFGTGPKYSRDYIPLSCSPSEIIRYGNSGEIVYNPEEGVIITLNKQVEKKTKKFSDFMEN